MAEQPSSPLRLGAEGKAAVRTWTVEDQIKIPDWRKGGLEVHAEPVAPVLDAPDEKRPATLGTRRRPEDQDPSNQDH